MALKQDFTKQLEGQLAAWQGQIKDYQERMAQAGAQLGEQAKADYEKGLAQLKANADEASKLLAQARDASEAAWKDMQAASSKALRAAAAGLGRRAEAVPVTAERGGTAQRPAVAAGGRRAAGRRLGRQRPWRTSWRRRRSTTIATRRRGRSRSRRPRG